MATLQTQALYGKWLWAVVAARQRLFKGIVPIILQGFEIGSGFSGSAMLGSTHNDHFHMQNGQVRTKTNRSGGVQGACSVRFALSAFYFVQAGAAVFVTR